MIRVALHHKTRLPVRPPVTLSPQVVRLRPAPHSRTPVTGYSLRIEPSQHFINWQQDPQGNFLARARLPGADDGLLARSRSGRRDDGDQPVRLLPRAAGRALSVRLRRAAAAGTGAVPGRGARRAAAAGVPRVDAARADPRPSTFLVDLNRRLQHDIRYVIRMEPGVQTSEETLELATRFLPRLVVAAGRGAAPSGLRRALRLGLSDSAHSPTRSRSTARPGPTPTSPICTRGPRCICRARAGSASTRRRDCSRARGTSRSPPRRAAESAAPVTGLVSPSEVEFHHEMSVTRVHEDPRVTKPYTDEQWQAIAVARRSRGRASWPPATCGSRWAASRRSCRSTTWTARSGTRRPWARRSGGWARRCSAACATRSRPGACCTSGRASGIRASRCRAGPTPATGATDGVPLWRDPALVGDPDRDYGFGTDDARAFAEALAERLAVGARTSSPPTRTRSPTSTRSARSRSTSIPRTTSSTIPKSASGCAACSAAASARRPGSCCRSRACRARTVPRGSRACGCCAARHLFLVPGDSPVGFRLPIDSLPGRDPAFEVVPADPLAPREPFGPGASAAPLRVRGRRRTAPARAATRPGGRRQPRAGADAAGRRRTRARRTCARRSASRRATARSGRSCRRSRRPRTTWS